MVTPHPILDTSNVRDSATVQGSLETSMSSLPLGKTGAGEVYVKVGAVAAITIAGVTVADGGDTALGTTTDAPVADNTTAASATAATGIKLWKRLVNLGIAILAKLPTVGTAGTASTNVISVQGIAAGVPLPISGSFTIPAFDYQAFTYVGSTNNVATQVFKTGGSGGTTVATLTFAYAASGAADNDKITSITRS